MSSLTPLLFVTVGTDYHPFDRIVEWTDRLVADVPDLVGRTVVQYGTSRPPTIAEGVPFLSPEQLESYFSLVRIVVVHGGPSTITEALRHGHLPICVPRDPAIGEHVDAHQQRFSRYMAGLGAVELASDESAFRAAILTGLKGHRRHAPRWTPPSLDVTADAVGRVVQDMLGTSGHQRRGRRGRVGRTMQRLAGS